MAGDDENDDVSRRFVWGETNAQEEAEEEARRGPFLASLRRSCNCSSWKEKGKQIEATRGDGGDGSSRKNAGGDTE